MDINAPVYSDTVEEIRRLQTENLVLKDNHERMQLRLDRLQTKFGDVANTKTDLSQQLLLSEEEKLKVSQSLVDLQIENNRIMEEAEATKFELTNKIILLQNQMLNTEAERDKYRKSSASVKERLSDIEKDRKDLADEYVVLKTNYLALTKEHQNELTRNEELAIELLNLVNNKATLLKQVAILTNTDYNEIGDPNVEIDRVRAIVAKNSHGHINVDGILGTRRDRDIVEQTLFASKKKHDVEYERMKRELGNDNKRIENRMTGLMKELADTRNIARERQQKISEMNAKLITLRGENQVSDTQFNRLQHKAKNLGEDFRARLVKYVEDIADYVDRGSCDCAKLRDYSDTMLKDIRRSHRERENQLSDAAQMYRKQLQRVVHCYQEVLIAYRNLRQICEARGFENSDLGPDEHEIKLSDFEIESSHLRELDKVNKELVHVKNELDAMKIKYGIFGESKESIGEITVAGKSDIWGAMRKQMREFTLNTQKQLEEERAGLLSDNLVLKEQLTESQQYIDSHLARYKQEVLKLRGMLGMERDGAYIAELAEKQRGLRL